MDDKSQWCRKSDRHSLKLGYRSSILNTSWRYYYIQVILNFLVHSFRWILIITSEVLKSKWLVDKPTAMLPGLHMYKGCFITSCLQLMAPRHTGENKRHSWPIEGRAAILIARLVIWWWHKSTVREGYYFLFAYMWQITKTMLPEQGWSWQED
jgi:hypothetical protein